MGKVGDRLKEAAEEAAREKVFEKQMDEQRAMLYEMRVFDTITHPMGWPMVMRAPGGWIFYIQSGGSHLITQEIAQDSDGEPVAGSAQQTMVGSPVLMPVFVPYTEVDRGAVQLSS